jgi:hypothetical protein
MANVLKINRGTLDEHNALQTALKTVSDALAPKEEPKGQPSDPTEGVTVGK